MSCFVFYIQIVRILISNISWVGIDICIITCGNIIISISNWSSSLVDILIGTEMIVIVNANIVVVILNNVGNIVVVDMGIIIVVVCMVYVGVHAYIGLSKLV